MKKNILKSVALSVMMAVCGITYSQVNYSGCTTNGETSSAIGKGCVSSGKYSFSGGLNSSTSVDAWSSFSFGEGCNTQGRYSKAIGYHAIVGSSGTGSAAIGNEVTVNSSAATAIGTFITLNSEGVAIGRGVNNIDRMIVDRHGVIAFGFDSNLPTMTVFSAPGKNRTGKVAIGNVTGIEPSAKLHIKADKYNGFGEDADILLQSQAGFEAAVCFQNKNNKISVATGSNIMNFTAGGFSFTTGKVGIGCENTVEGYALAVNGGVMSTRVSVMDVDEWPDYVFGKDYERMSLYELEEYIDLNHHLPEVPSAEEVSEQGIDLGEMNAILLQKVEELTLHVIELQKQIDIQQNEINIQQNEIDELKGR